MKKILTLKNLWKLLAFLIPIGIAFYALIQSHQAIEITKMSQKLDIEPRMMVDFEKTEEIPTKWILQNAGLVDAVGITFDPAFYYLLDGKAKILHSDSYYLNKEDNNGDPNRLNPFETAYITYAPEITSLPDPKENSVLEIRISYQRDADSKFFEKRKFYFLNEEGHWIPENDELYRKFPEYAEMKEKIIKQITMVPTGDYIDEDVY